MKSWSLAKSILARFFPSLIPGVSVIHHNDSAHYYTGWIHLLMYKLRSSFEAIGNFYDAVAFKYVRPIPHDLSQSLEVDLPLSIFTKREVEDAFAHSSEIASDFMQPNIVAAKVMFFLHLGDLQSAQQELKQARLQFGDVRDLVLVIREIQKCEHQRSTIVTQG